MARPEVLGTNSTAVRKLKIASLDKSHDSQSVGRTPLVGNSDITGGAQQTNLEHFSQLWSLVTHFMSACPFFSHYFLFSYNFHLYADQEKHRTCIRFHLPTGNREMSRLGMKTGKTHRLYATFMRKRLCPVFRT